MTYHALGTEKEDSDTILPTAVPMASGGSFANMSVCDLQRRLVTAGKRVTLDGKYGPNTETALKSFIDDTVPLETIRRVVERPSLSHVLPPLGTRGDYATSADKTHVTIPANYHSWIMLKAPSSRQCTGGGSATPRPPTPGGGGMTPQPGVEIDEGNSTGATKAGPPWALLGGLVAVAAAAGGGYYWWRKRKYPGT